MDRYLKLFTLIMLVFVLTSCLGTKVQYPLKLENASYQTWDAGVKHRGTKVEAVLVGETEDVKITELVFRSKSAVPVTKIKDGKLVLTADFESGTEKKNGNLTSDIKVDMIRYIHEGKVYELPLKDILRKPMKYYPKQ